MKARRENAGPRPPSTAPIIPPAAPGVAGALRPPHLELGGVGHLDDTDRPDWSLRPSFLALQSLHSQIKAEQGR